MYDLIVVGAGVWGTSAALAALRQGARDVLLLEANFGAAEESSAKSGGIVTALLWNAQDRVFVERSRELYREAAELGGDGSVWRRTGMLTLGGPKERDLLEGRAAQARLEGSSAELLDGGEVRRRFPDLDRLGDDAIGLFTPNDWHVNPTAYAQAALGEARRLGLTLRTGARVARISARDGGAEVRLEDGSVHRGARVLVSAGCWTRKLLAPSGVDLPLRPYRTQLSSLRLGSAHRGLPVVWHLPTDIYLVPEGAQNILAGDGTEYKESDPDTFRREGDPSFVESVAERLIALTRLGDAAGLRSAWAGLCGATPDRRPLVGAVGPSLFCACGDQGIGVMRGPAIGELAAQIALGAAQEGDLSPLRLPGGDFPIRGGFTLD